MESQSTGPKKRLVIIDANSVIHRAFHALPPLTTKKGEPVGAVYGFLLVFLKAVRELMPEYIAACFDVPGPTFRHKQFEEYKAKRVKAPSELYRQIPKVKEILSAFGVPVFEKEGFEADDIIGTISFLAGATQITPEIEIIILSGDLDNLQLVDSRTKVYFLRKGVKDTILYDENLVKEKYQGLAPDDLVDFRALRGDPSDNIPGVKGVGEKIATELIKNFGAIDNLYREIEKNTEKAKKLKPRIKEILVSQKESAVLSRSLSIIRKDAPVDFNLKECSFAGYDKDRASKILEEYEFYSLVGRLNDLNVPVK